MPDETKNQPYLDPYRRSQAKHGANFEVTLWASPRSQKLRFEIMAEMCFLGDKRILDAGCSRGDFAAFLIEREIPFRHFVGLDALCEVIDFANGRRLPRCDFRCGDFLTHPQLMAAAGADVVCISGALNTMTHEQVFGVLDGAWKAAGQTLMFNFLSDRCGPEAPLQDDFTRRLPTIDLLEWAMARTPLVSFRQDYFRAGHDATILMRREQ